MKTCSRCLESKDYNNFPKSRSTSDGYYSYCKDCLKALRSSHEAKVKIKKRSKDYYAKNKEKIKATTLKCRRKRESEDPSYALLTRARHRARQLGLEFNLTSKDIIIPSRCPIMDITLKVSVGRPTNQSPTLDRIDNSKGYVKGNVAVISWKANTTKSNLTIQDVERLLAYMKRGTDF